MFGLSLKELAAVAAVGALAAWGAKKVPVLRSPLLVGSVLYTAGYIVATKYPPGTYPQLQG